MSHDSGVSRVRARRDSWLRGVPPVRGSCLVAVASVASGRDRASAGHSPAAEAAPRPPQKPVAAGRDFVGSDTCLACHEGIEQAAVEARRTAGRRIPQVAGRGAGLRELPRPGSRHIENPSDDTLDPQVREDGAARRRARPACRATPRPRTRCGRAARTTRATCRASDLPQRARAEVARRRSSKRRPSASCARPATASR